MKTLREIGEEQLRQLNERRTRLLEAQRRGEPVILQLKHLEELIDMLEQGLDRLNRLKEKEQ